ncbi:hypothetical protein [Psychrobacillus lasiicapitis]|uniref:Uncharacterized protein n=1 Tax=Psychrobacillus lasiicapitis TaxID=1636719 RepID=A0A544SZS4_9BACI|nr:hypothetical protein [Psychrobacillus lasiicapitis]TQR10708.1 hypothetical protein FG382_16720 [Psychrobacillus lasiicapitis]GGA43193.1 hypothetical protein GCM10011384_36210 [Psychrobacillus lasiicapitis]
MTNWCRGIIEIKGKGEDIKRFLINKLGGDAKEIIDKGNKLILHADRVLWIEGTERNCIEGLLEFEYNSQDNESYFKDDGFHAARYIDSKPYVIFSKDFNLDFYISGVEVYGCFEQEIIIKRGIIVKEIAKKFEFER